MPTIVANCVRCGAKKMTFDVKADVWTGVDYTWSHKFEICVVCRRCERPSLMRINLRAIDEKQNFRASGTVTLTGGDLEPRFSNNGFLNVADLEARPAPESLPENIQAAFHEGAKCLAVNCPNAASAMFRLCLDLATKELLPAEGSVNSPNPHERRNLAPRLRWLFANNLLPSDLKDLSNAVKENGDEGAHDGHLTEDEALDIFDFAFELLDRLFSQPARLSKAQVRREQRRASAKPAVANLSS